MKKIFSLIIMFLSLVCSCQAKNVKFIQVTDVHLNQNNSQYLEKFVKDVNTKYKDLDFIVFTGDNLDKAHQEDLSLFLDIIKNLNIKPYVLLGNHDLLLSNEMTKEFYMKKVRKELGSYHSDKPNYVFEKKNVVFITMNGVKEVIPMPNGYFKQDELIWLDKMLTKYSDKKIVILQHFPLLYTKTMSHNLYKKEDYERVLKKHNNVVAIVSGHYHANIEQKVDDIYHIVTKKFLSDGCYKIIEIDMENDMIFTFFHEGE